MIRSQNDIAGLNVAMHDSRVTAMQFLQNVHDWKQPGQNFLLTTGRAALLDQLQQRLSFDELHYQVEASIGLKGIIDLGEMPAPDREEDGSLHQRLAASSRSNIIRFFDGTGPITLAGIDTPADSTETTFTDHTPSHIPPPNPHPPLPHHPI